MWLPRVLRSSDSVAFGSGVRHQRRQSRLSFDWACHRLGFQGVRMTRLIRFLWQCAFLFLATVCLWGQFTRGVLVGRVTDPSGAVVPKAQVKLVNQNTNIATTSETSPQGDYTFPTVEPGAYSLTTSAAGFE